MKNLNDSYHSYYNSFFSHIYVEKSVINHPRTKQLMEKFPEAEIIEIDHYKDVFCRSRQYTAGQHRAQQLILAAKKNNFIYEGAPVCQSFGNDYFYYTSCMMNCVFDCEYCYLKGMYPSGNVVIFVNLEDFFEQVEKILEKHEVYLCVSYDTDLMAVENIAGYTEEWVDFAKRHSGLKIEIRTKSANKSFISRIDAAENVIYAFTLSPQAVIESFEHRTAPLKSRLECAALAISRKMKVRLAFDPMIYCKNWREAYREMFEQVCESIDFDSLFDVSVGTFRVSVEYLKKMKKQEPYSPAVQFPFVNDNGFYHYPRELMLEMENEMVSLLKQKIPENKIFLWEN